MAVAKFLKGYQDEWANDWKTIVKIFEHIDDLRLLFNELDVSHLREIQQKILILNLEKYAYSLQSYLIEKYSN
ncbi:hypothetical protein LCGC14_1541220 [marine sediment metagenome]|jgi:hypothetical protein|uniref:Uncharacterized protein n=1 Tax=marine sediment metagenome TaxID=412755 RepID=A0A0F9IT18_9ZZZZ|nr:MAG: hypothetical protein Lokiarch_14950 [Candidatus Lokiarchaeum sp. GC14_75]